MHDVACNQTPKRDRESHKYLYMAGKQAWTEKLKEWWKRVSSYLSVSLWSPVQSLAFPNYIIRSSHADAFFLYRHWSGSDMTQKQDEKGSRSYDNYSTDPTSVAVVAWSWALVLVGHLTIHSQI